MNKLADQKLSILSALTYVPLLEKMQMRRCTKCGIEQPLTNFGRDKKLPNGVIKHCKTCRNERVRINAINRKPASIESKVCSKCGVEKPSSEFSTHRYTKTGLLASCKSCTSEAQRDRAERRRKNNSIDKTIPIRCPKCGLLKSYSDFNKDSYNTNGLQTNCRECNRNRHRSPEGLKKDYERRKVNHRIDPRMDMLRNARKTARIRGVPFNLTKEDIIIPKTCPILGVVLQVSRANENKDNSPSLDRVVPELGYVRGNVAVVSYRGNRIKNDGNIEEHEAVITYMKIFQQMNKIKENNLEPISQHRNSVG